MPDYINPQTGNGEVWSVKPEGYMTREEWNAAHPYVPEPISEDQLWCMLRVARDMKLAATDYLMMTDYPLSDHEKGVVATYRQALRDLPAQVGAPWDGGGNLTPWPVKNF